VKEPPKDAMEKLELKPTVETLAALGPVARSSVVDAVVDRLRGEILAGRLAPGSRIPSERELSLALGVNRLTLRAALGRLEAVGLIATRHGAGTVVASWRERAGLDALASLIAFLQADDAERRDLVISLLELRRIVAAEAIALAAERRTKKDLDLMTVLAADQVARVNDPIAFARGDVAFVRAICRATRNVALELVLNTFARFPDEHPELVAEMFDRPDVSLQYYSVVIELIRRGDPQLARELVRRELDKVDEGWARRHPQKPVDGRGKRGKR
jgi:GntR family transcriptional regulator, transcriptional repressor for pyruvate dehydrogenase complex